MGHSTSSGRASGGVTGQERELRSAVRSGDLDRANRIQNSIDRGTLASDTERRAVDNFMRNRAEQLNSAQGAQIASNEFQFAGMSNERAVDIMNASGRDRYEIHEERQRGSIWTNGAPTIRRYIRKVNGGRR